MRQIQGELCNFTASDKILLTGFLYNPSHSKKAMIYLHGMGSSMIGGPIWAACAAAKKARWAVLTFNNRGTGLVMGFKKQNGKYLTAGTACERFEDCILDIEGAIRYLKKRDFKKIILIGHSTGCQKAVFYSSKKINRTVRGLVLLAPCDDLNISKKEAGSMHPWIMRYCKFKIWCGQGNTPIWNEKVKFFSPRRILGAWSDHGIEANLFNYKKPILVIRRIRIPILSVLGKDEQYAVIPPATMLELLRKEYKNKKSSTALVPGAHNFKGGEKELTQVIANWLKKIK